MRDNTQRITPTSSGDDLMEGEMGKQSVLNYPSPTEFVELPSKGLYYPEGHSLHGKDTIEVRLMSAKEEDILSNKSLLKKGHAIDRLLSSLIVDRTINVDDLFVGDKNALLIAIRISAYGPEYKTLMVCPQCEHKFENNFDLETIKRKETIEELNADGTFPLTLPKTKASVVCKLLTGRDEKYLAAAMETKRKHKLLETPMTDQLKALLISVNGDSDKGTVGKFVESLPTLDSRFLRTEYAKMVPDVDTNFSVVCPQCDADSEVSMPLAAEFFWPK